MYFECLKLSTKLFTAALSDKYSCRCQPLDYLILYPLVPGRISASSNSLFSLDSQTGELLTVTPLTSTHWSPLIAVKVQLGKSTDVWTGCKFVGVLKLTDVFLLTGCQQQHHLHSSWMTSVSTCFYANLNLHLKRRN